MDALRLMDALQRVEHRHGDGWHLMEELQSAPEPGERDRERSWLRGKIFRCTTCDDQIRVVPPENEHDPASGV